MRRKGSAQPTQLRQVPRLNAGQPHQASNQVQGSRLKYARRRKKFVNRSDRVVDPVPGWVHIPRRPTCIERAKILRGVRAPGDELGDECTDSHEGTVGDTLRRQQLYFSRQRLPACRCGGAHWVEWRCTGEGTCIAMAFVLRVHTFRADQQQEHQRPQGLPCPSHPAQIFVR